MTTMNILEISHKKNVAKRYNPNSYRIFCEDIGNNSVEDTYNYVNDAPDIYSRPTVLPAQASELRNKPHGSGSAGFLRENPKYLNEPINIVNTKPLSKTEEKRWWEWNTQAEDSDPLWKNKKRSQSSSNLRQNHNESNGFQTTYQKEHGYLSNDFYRAPGTLNELQSAANRHSANPNTMPSTGIVPVSDLKNYGPENQQRMFVDKMSFEHVYNARDANNYPNRGKRHGAFVLEQVEPKPFLGTKVFKDQNTGTSVWDIMHPTAQLSIGSPTNGLPPKPNSSKSIIDARNQRRDPIGYFEDTKYTEFTPIDDRKSQQQLKYTPSWNEPVHGATIMNNNSSLNTQIPIAVNDHYNHD